MGVNEPENPLEAFKDFFWQTPQDRAYAHLGGDGRVPEHQRTDDPKADANRLAAELGERIPYPNHDEGVPLFDPTTEELVDIDSYADSSN